MSKVYDQSGFQVYVYGPPREHLPPHVHVECVEGGEVLIKLGDEDSAPSLWRNHHMKEANARRAWWIVAQNEKRFLREWRRLHGS